MANLIIPFPEGTRTVVLRGARITIGRLPENTVQLRDRTVSAHHAELIQEGEHYRIQDLDSTNGVMINGKQVRDYHLREDCAVRLGGIDCEFHAQEAAGAENEMAKLPDSGEVMAVKRENDALKAEAERLRQQVAVMKQARDAAPDGPAATLMEEFDKMAGERSALQQAHHEQEREIERLREAMAVIRRDRENLQRAYDDARAAVSPRPIAPAAPPTIPPPTALATAVATEVVESAASEAPPALPKPPIPLGTRPPTTPPPKTPTRRPASGIRLAPIRVIGAPAAAPAPGGPKGTQKLVE